MVIDFNSHKNAYYFWLHCAQKLIVAGTETISNDSYQVNAHSVHLGI